MRQIFYIKVGVKCHSHICNTLVSSIPCHVQALASRSAGFEDQVLDRHAIYLIKDSKCANQLK